MERLLVDSVSMIFSVDKNQKVDVLNKISFSANPGEFIAFLGPSGCGKTTLLRIIAGLLNPTSGGVYVDGQKVEGAGKDRGMVFQAYTSFDWLTVEENIDFGLKLNNVSKEERKKIIQYYINAVGLQEFRNAYPKNLSGGMKQRLALARTLANKPRILLMDEPFGALDFNTRWSMRELLLNVWEREDCTVIFVTHDLEEAMFLADQIYITSSRPATIFHEVNIPFARPRSMNLRTTIKFINFEKKILSLMKGI